MNNKFIDIKTKKIENGLIESIDQDVIDNFKNIKLMPDTHIGKSVPIGFVSEYHDKIIPNIVGVDIGCGMACATIPREEIGEIEFKQLEEHIRKVVPTGFNLHESLSEEDNQEIGKLLDNLSIKQIAGKQSIINSLGTLGGGNHFIELDVDDDNYYLVVHTGSRSLGAKVCKHHQDKLGDVKPDLIKGELKKEIELIRENSPKELIGEHIKELREKNTIKKTFLENEELEAYLNDMNICVEYAQKNRKRIIDNILKFFGNINVINYFDKPHNYIDTSNKIIRKGSQSAQLDEDVIIPINMKDGFILAKGRGAENWLYSAPHGAGRLLSRREAKAEITLQDFKDVMKGVNTFSDNEKNIDESPMAYKSLEIILEESAETLKEIRVIKTLYNFKDK